MKLTSAKVLLAGLWQNAPEGIMVSAVITDSREAAKDCVFVAIEGERVDGHKYAKEVFDKGATAIVAVRYVEGVPKDRTVIVQDPLQAMITMGKNYRKQFSPIIVGVTGSVGKTTTKEFCAAIFSAFGETVKNEGNQNNEIGLPKTLFKIDDSTKYAVVEMGMQGFGQIRDLTMAALPSAAIITNIGMAHIEFLGSKENILKAKMEICEGLPFGGTVAVNGEDELLRSAIFPSDVRPIYVGIGKGFDVCAFDLQQKEDGQKFKITDKQFGDFDVFIPAFGKHNVTDALLSFAACTRLGLEPENVARAMAKYQPSGMRQNIVKKSGIKIIEDCYNASPDSMKAALKTMIELPGEGRRIAVLGDMLELGGFSEQAHSETGEFCAEVGVDILVTVGVLGAVIAKAAKASGVQTHSFEGNGQAADFLKQTVQAGDIMLLKASNGMNFAEISQSFG